jgi:hypothetical protein
MLVPKGEGRARTYARAPGHADDLTRLVTDHGYDPRVVGTLHGKRLAHLRRETGSSESVLTERGREVAEQYLFARRLSLGGRRGIS